MNTTEKDIGATPEKKHGRLYYLFRNIRRGIGNRLKNNRKKFLTTLIISLGAIFGLRGLWQPELIWIRNHLWVVLVIGVLYIVTRILKKVFSGKLAHMGITVMVLLLVAVYIYSCHMGFDPHDYLSGYLRFQTLKFVELKQMPLTDHERTRPRQSLITQAGIKLTQNETISQPHFGRVGDQYNWTMIAEPPPGLTRFYQNTKAVFNISAEDPYPDFTGKARVEVTFETGEHLQLGKNVTTNTIKTFGPWRFLNYEPAEMFPTLNDKGRWVQVVRLIRWSGLIFPWPEFGGVVVIPNSDDLSIFDKIKLWVIGVGKWIPPEEISEHPFLKGQALVPALVQRFEAESFRFHRGFLAAAPFFHESDVKIPDMPGASNDQPFTTYFLFPSEPEKSKLYGYFSLEPYIETAKGINTSMLCPADGQGPIFTRKHYLYGERLTGSRAVPRIIQDSRKAYTWQKVSPEESRPYIKEINGVRTFFWLSTVVTLDEKNPGELTTGGTPEIAIVDPGPSDEVFWVNPRNPKKWVEQIIEQREKNRSGN